MSLRQDIKKKKFFQNLLFIKSFAEIVYLIVENEKFSTVFKIFEKTKKYIID